MRRRDLIRLGGGAVLWPLAARAQQTRKVPIIGLMGSGTAASQSQWTSAFLDRLRELGWTEGRNIAVEYRWAEGRSERFPEMADEFVRLNVDVIVTHNTPGPLAAMKATSAIPIVFATAGDPVGTGLVASLARPGGNVTGLSSQSPDAAERRLELLREVVPGLRRLAILSDRDNPFTVVEISGIQEAARSIAVEVAGFEIRRDQDIAAAFDAFRDRAEALYVVANPIMFANRIRINTFALAARLPTMYIVREYVEAGGLMPNWQSMWRRSADLVGKILRGAKPAEIPVEQPTRFDFVLNLTTAKALGLKIPDKLLALANDVIE
jgi:putative tryptophan/tyrosine transport system substrate-binding protein